ncbi:uncharacterized protein LOC110690720 [Chenopodium quinoa]|uniref:uncharacterized protein LOC110690720 n=1 Tax=Chenopodium quinoa TaxID=63459 RepID=UPI000B79441E|nr:uncharacterized protein LOC110690720 [Chenopodium quinoa]
MSGEELWRCVKDMPKAIDGPEALKRIKNAKKGWFKQSILWELPYWKNLLIRHNLDVMHIEKNFFNQLINTVMDVKKHTSDTVAARKDMARVCKRTQLELTLDDRGKESMPKAPFTLDKAQKKALCEWVQNLRFPDGYASNLTRFVDLQTCKLRGMKSHDCHVFMERLLPVALKELLPEHVWKPITEISQFFRDLCSSTIKVSDMERLEHNIAEILCKLEVIFPPAFFDSMEHLPLHLPYEAKMGGPVQYRWMYPFERFFNHLKRKVGNKARVKSSICNAYLNEEIANFCSHYFQSEVDTKAQDLGKNVNSKVERHLQEKDVPELFKVYGHAPNEGSRRFLENVEYQHAHMYVLANCGILGDYEKWFEEHIVRTRPGVVLEDVWEKCEAEFSEWFKSQVLRSMTTSDVMRALALGPCKQAQTWSQFSVNGFSFQTYEYGKHKSTMNYGVCVSHQDGSEFGILDDVIELVYTGNLGVYKTILFKCSWMEDINIHEQYKLVEVNHVKKNPNCNPFVLPYQVRQVYFAPYPSLKKDSAQWWAVFKTKAKSVIDAQVDSGIFQEATIEVPPALCAPDEIPEYNGEEGISQDEDDGVEGMLVDAEEEADDDESSCDSSDDSGAADDDDEDDESDLFC